MRNLLFQRTDGLWTSAKKGRDRKSKENLGHYSELELRAGKKIGV